MNEIFDLIESVSEGFRTSFCKIKSCNNLSHEMLQSTSLPGKVVTVDDLHLNSVITCKTLYISDSVCLNERYVVYLG